MQVSPIALELDLLLIEARVFYVCYGSVGKAFMFRVLGITRIILRRIILKSCTHRIDVAFGLIKRKLCASLSQGRPC